MLPSVVNLNGKLILQEMVYQIVRDNNENKTDYLSDNDTAAEVPILLSATPSSQPPSGDKSRYQYQYYIIGVYAFFATMFVIGLVMIVGRKLHKACCPKSVPDFDGSDSHSRRSSLDSCDNPTFSYDENTERSSHQGNNSDYDYYSDEASNVDTNSLRDKPPDYEEPPCYSVVIRT